MRRAGWVLGIAWAITCLIGAWLSLNTLLAMLAVGAVAYLIVLCIPLLRRRITLSVGAAILICLLSLLMREIRYYLPTSRLVGTQVAFRAQMCDTDDAAVLRVIDGDLPKGMKVYLNIGRSDSQFKAYDVISGTFILYDYDGAELASLRRKANGVYFSVAPASGTTPSVTAGDVPWTAIFHTLRRETVNKIHTYLSGDEGAVVSGICLGAEETLSAKAVDAFRACGIWHLFSVSGFHLALIAQVLRRLLQTCRLPRIVGALAIAICMLFFMALVGFEPSVVRSGMLCLLVQAATFFKRQADSLNSLGLALLLLLAGNPHAVYDAGLQLSFCATYGLLVLSPRLKAFLVSRLPKEWPETAPRRYRLIVRILSASCVTLSAAIATLPISVLYFGEISLVSLPVNLIVTWPASVLMILGSLACLLFMVGGEALVGGFLFISGWIARFLLFISQKISEFPLVTVAIRDDYLLLWIVGSLLLLFFGWRLLRRRGVYLIAAVSVFILSISVLLHTLIMQGVTRVTVIPTKEDVALCAWHGGRTVLFCAPEDVNDLYTIRAELRSGGIHRVDVLILYGGKAVAHSAIPAVWDAYLEDTVLLYTVPTVEMADTFAAAYALPDGDVPLWEGLAITRSGEYWLLHAGETHFAVFPEKATLYALPPRYRTLQAVICRGEVTENLKDLPLVVWEDEPVVLMTRGKGDL